MTPVITRRCRAQETAIVARTSYERLSTQDSSFLLFEHRETPMHVAAIAVLEAGPLARRDGGGPSGGEGGRRGGGVALRCASSGGATGSGACAAPALAQGCCW